MIVETTNNRLATARPPSLPMAGSIPPELGNLKVIVEINLANNRLSGEPVLRLETADSSEHDKGGKGGERQS